MALIAELPGLRLEHDNGRAVLLLRREEKANALTMHMWDALPDLVAEAERSGARVLVLASGSTKVFSAGADVAEYRANVGSPEWGQANHRRVTRATRALAECVLPTVAVVAGGCSGGGVGLIAACDLRLAADNAMFSVPPAKLGLVYPQFDTARLLDLIGPAATKRMLFTGGRFDAGWALRVGLVDEVVPLPGLRAAADELTAQIAACSPMSVSAMKRTVAMALAGVRDEDQETRRLLAEALAHPDHAEGVAALLERRAPVFGGDAR